jgi:uncharacterized protein
VPRLTTAAASPISLPVKLRVKVVPKASRDEIVGWLGDALKVSVTAPPVRGQANDALVTLLARALGLARARITVVAGGSAARKTVEIEGLSLEEIRARILSA